MTDYMGKISEKAFENLARASVAQDKEIDDLRDELATVKRQRDQWERNAFEALATIERTRAELATVTAERDTLRAKLDAVPADDIWTLYDVAVAKVMRVGTDAQISALGRVFDWLPAA